jgi:hypothetical protein
MDLDVCATISVKKIIFLWCSKRRELIRLFVEKREKWKI